MFDAGGLGQNESTESMTRFPIYCAPEVTAWDPRGRKADVPTWLRPRLTGRVDQADLS
jgi:hypothetical protein